MGCRKVIICLSRGKHSSHTGVASRGRTGVVIHNDRTFAGEGIRVRVEKTDGNGRRGPKQRRRLPVRLGRNSCVHNTRVAGDPAAFSRDPITDSDASSESTPICGPLLEFPVAGDRRDLDHVDRAEKMIRGSPRGRDKYSIPSDSVFGALGIPAFLFSPSRREYVAVG